MPRELQVHNKPKGWKTGTTSPRASFTQDRIMDFVASPFFRDNPTIPTLNTYTRDYPNEDPVKITLQSLLPWPGIEDLKVNTDEPFVVILFDEDPLQNARPDFFEVAFFDGKQKKSILRSDLMDSSNLKTGLVDEITSLNADYALDKQWTLARLAEEAQKPHPDTESSLGEWEQGFIIGEAKEWTEMEPMPFANWLILPPFLQDPELQAQCEHEWRKASIPIEVERDGSDAGLPADGIKEIWVCQKCDLMVDENPEGEPEEDKDEDEAVDAAKDELRKKMEKIWEDKERERKKKGKSPYDDLPPYGEPWKEKSPWKPNPYEPYKPSDDGWDKWVKHNNWMAKYSPNYSANPESGASA